MTVGLLRDRDLTERAVPGSGSAQEPARTPLPFGIPRYPDSALMSLLHRGFWQSLVATRSLPAGLPESVRRPSWLGSFWVRPSGSRTVQVSPRRQRPPAATLLTRYCAARKNGNSYKTSKSKKADRKKTNQAIQSKETEKLDAD